MYLEKLEIQGFKSFANPIELKFNRDLTAIVGPNGSGKSNAADAVRWVLGEQSSKSLRGKKAEDVIFAGSDKKSRLGFAQVDLYLNNEDKAADIDFEQIIITRKIDRKGDSEYLVNNNKVRLLDVQMLLAKANFGQKTYSVIGQGMIDYILVSSAAERKEFFDEATGVKQFQIKKDQSINKLKNSKNNLKSTDQILQELEPRLRSLTRQASKLEKKESLGKELYKLQTSYYSFLSNNLEKSLGETKSKFNVLQKDVSDLNQELVELQTSLEREEKTSSRQENFQLLQNKLIQAQNELNSLTKEKTILEGQADLKLMSGGQVDIVWLSSRLENLSNETNKNKLLLHEKKNDLKSGQEDLSVLEERRNKILAEFEVLEKKLLSPAEDLSNEELSDNLNNIFQAQQKFEEALDNLKGEENIGSLRETCKNITQSIRGLWNKLRQSNNSDRQKWQQEFNDLLGHKDNLVSEISDARTKTALLDSDVKKLEQEISNDEQELDKLRKDRESLLNKSVDQGAIKEQSKELLEKIEKKQLELKKIEEEVRIFNEAEENKKSNLVASQKKFRHVQFDFNQKNNDLNEIKVSLARLETKQEELLKEIMEETKDFVAIEIEDINMVETKENIQKIKNQLHIIGGIDTIVIDEYKEVKERYEFLKEQTDDLNKAIEHLEKIIHDLDESISKQFDQSFKKINDLFSKYFKKLFSGGKAELILNVTEIKDKVNDEVGEGDLGQDKKESLEDSEEDPEEEKESGQIKKQYGIDIKATPPGKKLSNINMLSGGEKALTSIALVCAIIANNPAPFVVLDEVDAALDEANSIRFSEILQELSDRTQFVAITHNRATMHKAKIIYGVTMGDDGVSKLLSINFDEADEIAA